MFSSILLKKRTKLAILSKEDAQNSEFRSLFGRIKETIKCFRDLLTFNLCFSLSKLMGFFSLNYFRSVFPWFVNTPTNWHIWSEKVSTNNQLSRWKPCSTICRQTPGRVHSRFYFQLWDLKKGFIQNLDGPQIKGQLFSKCPFGVFVSTKKPMEFF